MIRRVDFWIGTHLFHPPIIWLCQRTGMTQYAFAGYAWLAAIFTLVADMRTGNAGDVVWSVVISLLAVFNTVLTAINPDMPRRPSFTVRMFIWAVAAIGAVDLLAHYRMTGEVKADWGLAWDAFALTAEYAKTIATIPPRKRRERAPAGKEAFP
jgi:hypothetical protein